MSTCPVHHKLRPELAEPPRFMQDLLVDKRGYPVPWFVDWIDGEPEFRAMDRRKLRAAINHKLCWVCGNALFPEMVFTIGPMCAVNRISSEPPSHRECAIYSAQNCPFLTRPHMVRREDGLPENFKANVPGMMVERNPGVTLLWYTKRYAITNSPKTKISGAGILFEIGRPFKLEWYCQGRPATRAEVLDSFEGGVSLLRETAAKYDGMEGMMLCEKRIAEAYRMIPR